MNRFPVLIDTDTGVDDALAILMALRLPRLEIRALTSVAGNAEVGQTTVNALRVLEIGGRTDIPVYPGAAAPIFRDQVTAHHVHGKNGIGDLDLPSPKRGPEPLRALDAIYREAVRAGGELVVIAIGPLTNLGLAFLQYRELPGLIRRIVVMGGSACFGNVTPAAEFNIFADPEAADIVLTAGVPVYLCGLDVTMKAYLTPEELDSIGACGRPVPKFVRDVTRGVERYSLGLGLRGMCMHDPVAVLYAADDRLFTTREAGVRVETRGRLTYGKTVTDLYSDRKMEHNAHFVTDVPREEFRNRMTELLLSY